MSDNWGDQYADNWNSISEYVKERDHYTCQICGIMGREYGPAELHAHHVHHKSEGGGDHPSNLITLCWKCHNNQHDHYVQPMTERARTNQTPVSAKSSRSSTSKQSWKVSDGPADENLQHIAENVYGSSKNNESKTVTNSSSTNNENPSSKDSVDYFVPLLILLTFSMAIVLFWDINALYLIYQVLFGFFLIWMSLVLASEI
ncbi:HNH endonuclease [Natronosalvus caseinilyticus]|uniref:HNH endonuclease n=1 Tax=Natronosalvus caseinilyticus TaxID=2953747 RepID=UPI0028A8263F|nr:HNH endonuclease [Natronosalvus caseinilyticus]